jgi:hypothetical protein
MVLFDYLVIDNDVSMPRAGMFAGCGRRKAEMSCRGSELTVLATETLGGGGVQCWASNLSPFHN